MTCFRLLQSIRAIVAAALSVTIAVSQSPVGRQSAIAPAWADRNAVIRPYFPVDVPPVRTTNSQRLAALVRGGALYLTAQDAIALALENNIDLEVSRYGPITAGWRLTRSEAGGALPGVPNAASQTGAVAAGQGVQGSQAAAGVSVPGGGGNTNNTANATISQIGPVTQNLDPIIQESSTFSHTSNPQPNAVQSVTNNLVSNTRAHNGVLQQGLLSGGLVSIRYTQNWLEENSPTNILNPSTASNLSINAQHNLLRGFGFAVNARNITIAKRNIGISDLNFRGQVIATVTQVLNAYNGLAASYEDARSRRNAADVAQQFLKNVRFQVEAGSVAPPEAINAEALSVTSNQQLVDAEATFQQRETQLKNLISRTGTADPLLVSTRIVPIDRIAIPDRDDLPPVEELVKLAIANRTDLLNQL
ncbi:MAG: TolC family protein [Bryobacteraceae bacterium]|nr:TolC family protein [Bryobacteraceae bacterium]